LSASGPPVRENAKDCGSAAGSVTSSTMTRPRWTYAKVQVTVSAGASPIEEGVLPSLHEEDARSQPAGVAPGVAAYVPGRTAPLSCAAAASVREKACEIASGPPPSVKAKLWLEPAGS